MMWHCIQLNFNTTIGAFHHWKSRILSIKSHAGGWISLTLLPPSTKSVELGRFQSVVIEVFETELSLVVRRNGLDLQIDKYQSNKVTKDENGGVKDRLSKKKPYKMNDLT